MDHVGYRFEILSHNVNSWNNKRYNLYNIYKTIDPDIILLSEHSNSDDQQIKIYNYDVIQVNPTQGRFDGATIAIKRNLKYKRGKPLEEAYLSVIIDATAGEIEIATGYQPPQA